ncbi:hypothetical protein [Ohtaekwangia koreensis]|uniref:Uncharacterized protein n=1 Tax=Ohtaekwangia koreensis TaxID=688867 RepID=A0A1T5JEG4_9BACT|nr:hypothetical protein [Ohtaekwangia koreensis]SKC49648.1 hypothetical protein SAMN05660236_1017 [Ohtaekwangia koreensis]
MNKKVNLFTLLIFVTSCTEKVTKDIFDPDITDFVFYKLLTVATVVIGGVLFVVFRTGLFVVSKISNQKTINDIIKNPLKAEEYSLSLDMPYNKTPNLTADGFNLVLNYIRSLTTLGNYRIIHTCLLDNNRILIFTELAFIDYDIGITGQPDDIRKKAYHNFLIRYHIEQKELMVYSDLYSNTIEKFQKEEFLKNLFNSTY